MTHISHGALEASSTLPQEFCVQPARRADGYLASMTDAEVAERERGRKPVGPPVRNLTPGTGMFRLFGEDDELPDDLTDDDEAVDGEEEFMDNVIQFNRHAGRVKATPISGRFACRLPSADVDLPEIEFWDSEKTLPRIEGGCVIVAYGPSGDMKTTLLMCDCLDAVEKGARVVFAAGEGGHGLRKARLPAAIRARGKQPSDLDGSWLTCPEVPNLASVQDVEAFVDSFRRFAPHIVVIDTLAIAGGGTEENSSAFGALLTGAIGFIRRELGCTVIVVHHTGKDIERGSRGHSSIKGNSDGMFLIQADKEARRITKTVEKMRDGADGFAVEYKVTPEGQLPIAAKLGRQRVMNKRQVAGLEAGKIRVELQDALAFTLDTGLATPALALRLAGPPNAYTSENDYLTSVEAWKQKLHAGAAANKGKPARFAGLFQRDLRADGKGAVVWFQDACTAPNV